MAYKTAKGGILPFLTILLLGHLIAADDLTGCPNNLKRSEYLKCHQDKCYEFMIHRRATWQQAEEDCKTKGGHLVTVRNLKEETFLMSSLMSYNLDDRGVWIGLNDRQFEKQFMWVSGETSNFTFWAEGQPDSFTTRRRFLLDTLTQGLHLSLGVEEDCVLLKYTDGGHWYDYPCEKLDFIGFLPEIYPYVCEYKKEIDSSLTIAPTTPSDAETSKASTSSKITSTTSSCKTHVC